VVGWDKSWKGPAHEFGAHLEVKSSERGSSFLLRMRYVSSLHSIELNASTLIHSENDARPYASRIAGCIEAFRSQVDVFT